MFLSNVISFNALTKISSLSPLIRSCKRRHSAPSISILVVLIINLTSYSLKILSSFPIKLNLEYSYSFTSISAEPIHSLISFLSLTAVPIPDIQVVKIAFFFFFPSIYLQDSTLFFSIPSIIERTSCPLIILPAISRAILVVILLIIPRSPSITSFKSLSIFTKEPISTKIIVPLEVSIPLIYCFIWFLTSIGDMSTGISNASNMNCSNIWFATLAMLLAVEYPWATIIALIWVLSLLIIAKKYIKIINSILGSNL